MASLALFIRCWYRSKKARRSLTTVSCCFKRPLVVRPAPQPDSEGGCNDEEQARPSDADRLGPHRSIDLGDIDLRHQVPGGAFHGSSNRDHRDAPVVGGLLVGRLMPKGRSRWQSLGRERQAETEGPSPGDGAIR